MISPLYDKGTFIFHSIKIKIIIRDEMLMIKLTNDSFITISNKTSKILVEVRIHWLVLIQKEKYENKGARNWLLSVLSGVLIPASVAEEKKYASEGSCPKQWFQIKHLFVIFLPFLASLPSTQHFSRRWNCPFPVPFLAWFRRTGAARVKNALTSPVQLFCHFPAELNAVS